MLVLAWQHATLYPGHKAQIINKPLKREVLLLLIKPSHVPGLAKRPWSAMNRQVWAASEIDCAVYGNYFSFPVLVPTRLSILIIR